MLIASYVAVAGTPASLRRRTRRPGSRGGTFCSHTRHKTCASSSPGKSVVVVVGEVLWDSLPDGLFLGGAPANVAVHAAQFGHDAKCGTRVGDDALGEEIVRRLEQRKVGTDLIQVDKQHRTGFVKVVLKNSEPTYDIVSPSAWDFIEETPQLVAAATEADVLVYGSLAQRSPVSRKTIEAVAAKAKRAVFDVNMRPPFVDKEIISAGLQTAWLVKLNEDEARQIVGWFVEGAAPGGGGRPAALARAIGEKFGCHVCVTAGGDGAALWDRELRTVFSHGGCKVTPADLVGAGDSFLAALIDGLLRGHDRGEALAFANAVGGFVASRRGATPALEWKEVEALAAASGAPTKEAAA